MLFVLIWLCQLNCSESKAEPQEYTGLKNRWYGPSYQPSWWSYPGAVSLRRDDFSYSGENGPNYWPQLFRECGGRKQSPINIQAKDLKKRKTKKSLEWSNYSKVPRRMIMQNSLHSIHANGEWKNSSYIPYITSGPLQQRYYFSQLHFHWGKNDSTGSEHTVNKKSFPLEMHVVHDRRTEDPSNLSEESNSDNLVVVSYMFEVSTRDKKRGLITYEGVGLMSERTPRPAELKDFIVSFNFKIVLTITKSDNPAFMTVLNGIKEVGGNTQKKAYVKPFAIGDLIEEFHGDYVTYKGSLTTPPCTEGVIWIISSKPIGISDSQMGVMRSSIIDSWGHPIQNYRPVQPLNGRIVYYIHC